MFVRTLLILAFVAQQLVLPVIGAHGSSQCEARADVTKPAASCCAAPWLADATDENNETRSGCTCIPSLCACNDHNNPDPVAPERNRSLDQLVPLLALPSANLPVLPRLSDATRPSEQVQRWSQRQRLQAILCIWRT